MTPPKTLDCNNDAMASFDAPHGSANCHDCGRLYGDEHGFHDLIIPYWAWKRISPSNDDGGLLCPSCICKRLHEAGIRCEGAFMSGSIDCVPSSVMNALRRVENIELAIEGRNNSWAAVRSLVSPNESSSPTAGGGSGGAQPKETND